MGILKMFWIMKFIVLLGNVSITSAADLRCYVGSLDSYAVFSLDNPTPLLSWSVYDAAKQLVVFAFGLEDKATDPSVQSIVGVYLGTANICLLNWEKEASTGFLGTLEYPNVVRRAVTVGEKFADALIILFNAGLSPTNVHLIGHSLGAQLYGYTGRRVIENSIYIVERITGLDPAGPIFDGIVSLRGLSASDGKFVDVIHTNPGGLGSNENTGTVDIRVNCGSRIQPGCEGTNFITFLNADSCSHNRVWEYFGEAIKEPTAFEARAAASCADWRASRGGNETIYLGDGINTAARGVYYMRTSSSPPFGLGAAGSQPASQ